MTTPRPLRAGGAALVVALALALAGCGSAHRPRSAAAMRDRNLITADEIAESSEANAYDLVKRLRPQFLVSRGPVSIRDTRPAMPTVYVDGVRYGDVASLATIAVGHIESIRFLSASDAQQRFGSDNVGGAIVVTTRS